MQPVEPSSPDRGSLGRLSDYPGLNDYGAALKMALKSGEITQQEFFDLARSATEEAYLPRDNPRAQSGHGGDAVWFRHSRWMIAEAIYDGGTFLDVGCANGHLIECLDAWLEGSGVTVEFYGLDISTKLVELAARRLPAWADRFFVGNALDWSPSGPFDYTFSMIIPDMPDDRQEELFRRMLYDFTKPGGRLIIGPSNESDLDDLVRQWGFTPDGYCEKSFTNRPYRYRRVLWFDRTT